MENGGETVVHVDNNVSKLENHCRKMLETSASLRRTQSAI